MLKVGGRGARTKICGSLSDLGQNSAKVGGNCTPVGKCPGKVYFNFHIVLSIRSFVRVVCPFKETRKYLLRGYILSSLLFGTNSGEVMFFKMYICS